MTSRRATDNSETGSATGSRNRSNALNAFLTAKRPDNIAIPRPKGLAGAAKIALAKMIEQGWLQEVDANLRRGEPLWRETLGGHGTALAVTDVGLLAIGIETVVAQTIAAIRKHADETPKPKQATQRAGTKQAMLITLLQAPEGATREATIAATGWKTHIAKGAMSGALGKKLGLVVTSATKNDGGGCIGSSRGWHDRAFAPAQVNPTAGSEPR